MACLNSGALVNLLEDMGVNENSSDDPKPVLLQVISIVPVLVEGDLWSNKGFYLKVSDSSHAMCVSLPQEQDEMILSDKLQLGQFIYVQKLEVAYPLPMLRGVRPVPGRHPCIGTPEDLVAATNLVKFHGAYDSETTMKKSSDVEKKTTKNLDSMKIHGISDLESMMKKKSDTDKKTPEKFRSSSASRARPNVQNSRRALNCMSKKCDVEKRTSNVLKDTRKISSSFIDKDSDSDSPKSSSSSIPVVRRRSWNGMEIMRIREISDSPVVKNQKKPIARARSACVSPIRSARYESSDENSSSTRRRKDNDLATKLVKSSNKSRIPVPGKTCEETLNPSVMLSSVNDKKWTETKISWDSLPATLVNLGKEVLRHRDVALLAAVEALQEASAAERLIKCLSTYSEFQSAKGDDPQPSVDKFFDLQDDLAHTRLIVQSLTKISPLRTSDTNSTSAGSIREVLRLAFERKENAASWIKAAVASNLSPFSAPSKPITASVDATNRKKKIGTISTGSSKPKGASIVKMHRKNGEIPVGLAADKDNPPDWVKGSALCAAAELANSLHDECRRWFLAYVEKFLDGVKSKTMSRESDSQIAGMMYQIKRVNDWLDVIVSKEVNSPKNGCKNSSTLEDSELEACGRVRNKIYGVLLKHVERTALALENMNATNQN